MTMNGIDISSWQSGIDLSVVPCDFVICKATGGVGYVNPDCDRAYQQAKSLGKKLGVYHFAREDSCPGSSIAEADFFVDNIQGYIGEAILVLDWEGSAVDLGVGWAKEWLDRVQERTGVKPLLYTYNNSVNTYDWTPVVNADYGLWNAGYFNYGTPMGYTPDAPLIGGTGPWPGAAMYQYTSEGRLSGWNGNLDLNVFYGDANAWDAYANPKKEEDMTPDQESKLNEIFNQVTSTYDPTGRNVQMNDHDHLKWIAKKQQTMYDMLEKIMDKLDIDEESAEVK